MCIECKYTQKELSLRCILMKSTLYNILLVGAGGALGAMLRYGVSLLCVAINWSSNLATLIVNITGSFAMGLLANYFSASPALLMATVGVCGGFTTFSTFSLQSITLLQNGRYGSAALYILGTVLLCIAFAALGCYVAGKLK